MIVPSPPPNPPTALPPPLAAHATLCILVVSVASLFLELLLIRWIGTEIRIFAYLQNTVLVVCFLGLGLGCFTCRRPFRLRACAGAIALLAAALALPPTRRILESITEHLAVLEDFVIWYQRVGTDPAQTLASLSIGLAATFVVMAAVGTAFLPLGRLLGGLLADHPRPLLAYAVNLAGSLAGIWLFVLVSAFRLPPVAWLGIAAVLLALLRHGSPRTQAVDGALLAVAVLAAGVADSGPGRLVVWSPYQKLSLERWADAGQDADPPVLQIRVNNVGYQALLDLGPNRTVPANDPMFPLSLQGYSQYDLPYLFHPNPRSALLVGAGSGNDAAGALRHGVERVVAVEIDPAIVGLGTLHHPEKPYSSERVEVVVDDARSYFETCPARFDVISFGLLDAHTTTSLTNARLDHYVYTRESIQRAHALLDDRGLLVLSFAADRPFIVDRIARTLRDVFGEEPMVLNLPTTGFGWGGRLFLAGDLATVRDRIGRDPALAERVEAMRRWKPVAIPYRAEVATDDWPYLYLEAPGIPTLHWLLAGLLGLLFLVARWTGQVPALPLGGREGAHFLFLGLAFMLLEVQNISKASVALGNTWVVNAVIISAVLLMALLATGLAAAFRRLPTAPFYVLLFGSCLGLWFVDLSRFAGLSWPVKAVLVGAITCLPMAFSGVVFARSYARARRRDAAIGANLLGALAGGVLQSLTFATGIRALLAVVAAAYLLAMLTEPRESAEEELPAQPAAEGHGGPPVADVPSE